MANTDYTYNGIMSSGTGSFKKETPMVMSASVKRMQYKLKKLGFLSDTADGKFGSNTEAAVIAFQNAQGLTPDGKAGAQTLTKLDLLWPDTRAQHYGRELTLAELQAGYNDINITPIEAVARILYNEDRDSDEGHAAVAKEIYNRLHSSRNFLSSGKDKTWKGILFSDNQYFVFPNYNVSLEAARAPDQYSSDWESCVNYAIDLVSNRNVPVTQLGSQCFHVGNGFAYPSNAVASTKIQIPAGDGNKFYDVVVE